MILRQLAIILTFQLSMTAAFANDESTTSTEPASASASAASCDPAIKMTPEERAHMFSRIESTTIGKKVVQEFIQKYGSLNQLVLQWDLVSYSQILQDPTKTQTRAIASVKQENLTTSYNKLVCIHITKQLPDIEHLADLVHEMTHANHMSQDALKGDTDDAERFVSSRIAGQGGEAEAFVTECTMKHEILKTWDSLCSPFAKSDEEMDFDRVVSGLYTGSLSASLTGEPYPVMLRKQFRNIQLRREMKKIEKLKNSGIQ